MTHADAYKGFLQKKIAKFAIFWGKTVNTFRHSIHGGCQYKVRF